MHTTNRAFNTRHFEGEVITKTLERELPKEQCELLRKRRDILNASHAMWELIEQTQKLVVSLAIEEVRSVLPLPMRSSLLRLLRL